MSGGGDIGRRAAHGAAWAIATSVGARAITLLSLAVLARLLTPSELGLFAFALAFMAYVDTIADLGTSPALVYWPDRANEVAQLTFVVGAASSVLWLAIAYASAPALASFMHAPDGAALLRVLALSFPIRALGAVHDAMLQRELRFRARALPELVMAGAKAAVTIALAAMGYGVWSLAWGQLAGLALWTASLWFLSPWRPSRSVPRDLLGPVLRYGRGLVVVNLVAALVHRADLIIVGRMLGTRTLGFYQMASRLPDVAVTTMVTVTSKVLFPAFSRLRAGGASLGSAYLRALRYMSTLTVPVALLLFALAEPLVRVFLGDDWAPAAPILRGLALYAGLRSLGSYTGDLLKATGGTDTLARLGIARAVVLLPTMIVAARWGATAVAYALAAVTGLYLIVSLGIARRVSGTTLAEMLAAMRPSLIGGTVLGSVLAVWSQVARDTGPLVALAGGALLGGAAYVAIISWLTPDLVREAIHHFRSRRGGEATTAAHAAADARGE